MSNFTCHSAADAAQCLVDDFDCYLDGSARPDNESHQYGRDNAIIIRESLAVARELGAAIENGDSQAIADIWLRLKPQVELRDKPKHSPRLS